MLAGASAVALLGATGASAQAGSTLTFVSLKNGVDDKHRVAEGYDARVLIRWGDAVEAGAPAFDPKAQTAAAQAKQFGYNNDYLAYMPLPRGSTTSDHGLLWVNHEYTNVELMTPGVDAVGPATVMGLAAVADAAKVALEQAAHSGSIVEVKREGGVWAVVQGRYNRRLTMATPMRIAGPVAGHARLKTAADPTGTTVLGTLNNCAGGKTPWGTVLTGEENVNLYFAGDSKQGPESRNHQRMGLPAKDRARYGWFRHDKRFDADAEPNELNRFGWIVEIDPYDPASMPIKRTALGRFKHEGATTVVNPDGRVVAYTGDDQAGEYIYKFVSSGTYKPGDDANNRNLLDAGTLHVARFDPDGTVAWLPLVHGAGKLTVENGFASQADILIETRRAADALGATRMDRPEDIEASPVTGRVYVALTNNALRGERWPVDGTNPRAKNIDGQILEIIPAGATGAATDHAATSGRWELMMIAGDPGVADSGARYHPDQAATGTWLTCPDNVAFDPKGRLYISTDQAGRQRTSKIADGIFVCEATGPARALVKMLFACPVGAEMCGPEFTPDGKTLFVAVQHPAEGSSYEKPSTRWPDFKDDMPPRPSVVAITRKDAGEIGG